MITIAGAYLLLHMNDLFDTVLMSSVALVYTLHVMSGSSLKPFLKFETMFPTLQGVLIEHTTICDCQTQCA